MISEVSITRILTTAKDFDTVGLVIISYYLRLYVVEEILGIKDRPDELTSIASELLDNIEQFKNEVLNVGESEAEDESSEVLKKLIEDQDKAKIYCVNFTMNLYNQKLEQVSKGPWNVDLKRGLWCCIDLFESILHLWKFDVASADSIRKRIKYCKVYLSRLAKGQLGEEKKKEEGTPQTEEEIDNAINDALNETKTEESQINEELSNTNNLQGLNSDENEKKEDGSEPPFMETRNETPKEEDIDALIQKLKEQDEMDMKDVPEEITDSNESESEENNESVKEEDAPEPSFTLPSAPTKIEKKEITPEPEFINEEESSHHRQYTQDDLISMMDKSSKIEKIQKLAKYAISALNYEDTVTAKDQLTQAIDLLNSMN